MAALARRNFFIGACGAVLVAGVGAGVWSWHRAERQALADLTARAQWCAVAFQDGELERLAGTREDLAKPDYAAVKRRLFELRRVQDGVRFVYLFRAQPGMGKVIFLADSEPENSADISLPGDEFPEAAESPGLQSIIATGRPATEGPLSDSFGVWVTAYAPVRGPGAATQTPPDIIGLDIAADTWRAHLLEEGFSAALYVWLLLGLPLVVQVLVRHWSAQERAIRKLSTAFEQSRSALLIAGGDGRIEYVNRGMCEQLGYTSAELVGMHWANLGAQPPEGLAEAAREGRSWEGGWSNRRKSGEIYPVNGVVTPVTGRGGRVLCFVVALQDMTEAKRIEADLRLAKERAESGDRAKGEFLNTMSHELRTPLNGIVGFTSLLLDTPLTSEQREYVHTVRSSGEALLRLTGDILDYSRMDSHAPPLDVQPCEVRTLLEEVLDMLSATAATKRLVLLHHVAPDVPAVAMVDPGRLRQVLLNVVGNAVKFTATGEVEVRVRARPVDNAGPGELWLDFAVRDTGPGISEEDQKRLFQPFTQLDGSLNRRHGGTGLGLAISRSVLRLLGGEISLRSEPGHGAVFRFSVPVKCVEPRVEALVLSGRRVGLVVRTPGLLRELFRVVAAAGGVPVACRLEELVPGGGIDLVVVDCDQGVMAQVFESAVHTGGWPAGSVIGLVTSAQGADDRRHLREVFHTLLNKPLHHDALVATLAAGIHAEATTLSQPRFDLRVLVVDDNPVNLRLLQGMVTTLGCRSVAVSGGREALDALARDGSFDLVLLDLRMPDIDGADVLRRVRAGEAGESARSVWITIVTAESQAHAREDLFAAGCDDFVPKPITLASCIAALQRVQSGGGKHVR